MRQFFTWARLMKSVLLLVFMLAVGIAAAPAAESDDFDPGKLVAQKHVLILGSYTDFYEARRHALAISRASKVRFSLRGMVYDKKRGLILPDDDPDGVYAGFYISRRYNTASLEQGGEETEFLSLERSEAYEGFRPGYYIIVGGIYNDPEAAAKAVACFRPIVTDAYAKKTKIYMGCIH